MSSAVPAGRVVSQRRLRRSTSRRLFTSSLYAVFVAAVLAGLLLVNWREVQQNFFNGAVWKDQFPEIITTGAKNTVVYTAASFAFGFALAIVLALMKLAPVGPYRWVATAYIEFFRGIPALLVVVAFGFAVPIAFGVNIGSLLVKIALALGLVSAAYIAETLRAGIQAVPRGQIEAARSLGMSHTRTLMTVVIPQAFRIVLPPMTNEFILLTKDTSLVFLLGLKPAQVDLTFIGRDALNKATGGLTALFVVGAAYLVITIPLGFLARWLERRTGGGNRP